MRNLYENNTGFKHYVDACCEKHKCDIETAFTFSWVKNAAEYYLDAEKGKISVSEFKAGCGGAEMGETK